MSQPVLKGQVLIDDPEIKRIVDDYLSGRTSLDAAVARVPRTKMSLLDAVLKVILPEDLYRQRRVAL